MATRNLFNKQEKLELFLNRDGAQLASRVMIGGLLGLAMSAGAGWVAAVCVGAVAFNGYAQNTVRRFRQKVLMELYRSEIAAVENVENKCDVTLSHLKDVAKPQIEGGKGIVALNDAMELFTSKRNSNVLIQATTIGVMLALMGSLAAVASAASLPSLALAGGAAFVYNEVYKMVDGIANISLGLDDKHTISREVRAINDQIALGGRISSTRVLRVFVEANPKLGEAIKAQHGEEYDELPVDQKRAIVKQYDNEYNLYTLTRDINCGVINPTELAFLAYGQNSGVPRKSEEDILPNCTTKQGKSAHSQVQDYSGRRTLSDLETSAEYSEQARLFDRGGRDLETAVVDDDFDHELDANVYDDRAIFFRERLKAQRLQDPFAERVFS